MMIRTSKADTALGQLEAVQANFEHLAHMRHDAIREALHAGASLRAVAAAAKCSYESVRRCVESHAVVFVWRDETFVMTEHATRMLEEKASGFAEGAFPKDVELLGAGSDWLNDARTLASELRRVQRGESTGAVVLGDGTAFALYTILRGSMLGRPNRVADLFDALHGVYG